MKPLVLFLLACATAPAQRALLRPAGPIALPGLSDSNSPVHWWNGIFHATQSNGLPILSKGPGQSGPLKVQAVQIFNTPNQPMWIESTFVDDDGTVYAWYHHEVGVCDEAYLSTPKIGALVSDDGGVSYIDLGIVLESGDLPDCFSQNGYFAGGHGDFTVLLDPAREYFYFYFSNYGGPAESQGVSVARMAYADRRFPRNRVFKLFNGQFREPGLRGRVTPLMQAAIPWWRPDADSFWGPAIHWNTFLNQYVMLLNRVCCAPGWAAQGIYVSFNPDLTNPYGWTTPDKILDGEISGWYPQVIGTEPGATDKVAGQVARFYMGSDSDYEIEFLP